MAGTLYDVLNVEMDADMKTIKKAYRREALKNHPDVAKAPDASNRFMEIQEAYKVLSDPKAKAQYDAKLRMGGGQGAGSSAGFDWGWAGASAPGSQRRTDGPFPEDLNDSFGAIFSDLFAAVSKTASEVKPGGIANEFVEFLENQFGTQRGDGLEDMINDGTVEELESELDDAIFVLEQMQARKERLKAELASAQKLESEWKAKAEREPAESEARQSAEKRKAAFYRESSRTETKIGELAGMIRKQETAISRLKAAITAKEGAKEAAKQVDLARNVAKKSVAEEKARVQREVDEELERMKRDLGMK